MYYQRIDIFKVKGLVTEWKLKHNNKKQQQRNHQLAKKMEKQYQNTEQNHNTSVIHKLVMS